MKTIIDIVLEKQVQQEKKFEELKIIRKSILMLSIATLINSISIIIISIWR